MSAFGSITALAGGTATLNPANGINWAFIQNQDVQPLMLNFQRAGQSIGQMSLSAAAAAGAPGGYLDSIGSPLFLDCDAIILTSGAPAGQFGSGSSGRVPFNSFGVSRS